MSRGQEEVAPLSRITAENAAVVKGVHVEICVDAWREMQQ
jgi:hypothetical protein